MPSDTLLSIGSQAPKPRIVQHRNRRYSIRLEPIFWLSLERLAERRELRLGHFIADLAARYEGKNFASHLRVVCMLEAEHALARASLQATRENVLDVISACPTPGLVLSRFRTILAINTAFADWIGGADKAPTGADLTSVIQVRTRRPLNTVWLDLIAGTTQDVEASVLLVEPGRAVAAHARILGLHPLPGAEFYAVMWLSIGRRAPTAGAPRPQHPAP